MNNYIHYPKILLTAILCLFATSCDVVFVDSLIDPKQSTIDKRLVGRWNVLKDSAPGKDFIEIKQSAGKLLVSTDSKQLKGKLMEEFYTFSCNENNFIVSAYTGNVQKKKQKGYLVLKYKLEKDSLKVWLSDPNIFKAAVKEGKLTGTAGENFDSTIIVSPTNEAKIFLCRSDDKMFGFLGELKKVK